jgi:hypothetical protein
LRINKEPAFIFRRQSLTILTQNFPKYWIFSGFSGFFQDFVEIQQNSPPIFVCRTKMRIGAAEESIPREKIIIPSLSRWMGQSNSMMKAQTQHC